MSRENRVVECCILESRMERVLQWWERILVFALVLSVALIGIGNLGFVDTRTSISAWSVSRTAFFFWLIGKAMTWARSGYPRPALSGLAVPMPALLFFATVTLSLLPDFHNAGDYRYFFFGCMHYLMIRDLCSVPQRSRLVFLLIALLPGVLFLRGIFHDPSVLELTDMRRFQYPSPHPNIAGYLFSMTIPIGLALMVGGRGKLRFLAALSCAAQIVALVLTYSRGAWLGWLSSVIFFGVALKRKEAGVLLILAGILVFLATPVRERVLSLISPRTDISINERFQAMQAGLKLGLAHPVLGVGYGRGRLREGLGELFDGTVDDIGHIAHTHNLYVELFAQTGALGLGAFLWLLGHGLIRVVKKARRVADTNRVLWFGIAASWVAFAVTGIGDVPFYHHDVRILFFTVLALIDLDGERISPRQV